MLLKYLLLFFLPITDCIMKCISIYGCETEARNFVCSWKYPVEHYISKAHELGFNTLRLPFSYQYVVEGNFAPTDEFFLLAYKYNMSVALDFHRIWSDHQGPIPEENISLDNFIWAWKTMLWRYVNYPQLIGHNCYNEYQYQDIPYITSYTERVFNEIEKEFPDRFIHIATGYNWASDLRDFSLEYLPYHDKIFYSIHAYPFSLKTEEQWNWNFGNMTTKLVLGEWGWMDSKPDEVEWAKRFIPYLKKRNITNTCYWTIAHSHDTGNLFQDDCEIIKWDNYNLLKTLWD